MDLFGPWICSTFVTALTVNWMNGITGGLLLVIYRFQITYCYDLIQNISKHVVMGGFLVFQLLLVVSGTYAWLITSQSSGNFKVSMSIMVLFLIPSGRFVAMEFCKGQSLEVADIFDTYTLNTFGEDRSNYKESGLWHKTLILISVLICTLAEITIYAIIFIDMYYHDKSMVKSLGSDNVRYGHN